MSGPWSQRHALAVIAPNIWSSRMLVTSKVAANTQFLMYGVKHMENKTELLLTDLPGLTAINCTACGQSTPHKVVASHVTRRVFEDDSLDTAMQIVRCEVCEAVSFRELYASRDHHHKNSDDVWVELVTEITYTRPTQGERRLFSADESTGIFD